MDLGIAGRTALVAASTGGLGPAVATALAAEGVRVAIVGRRRDRAKEIVAECTARTASPAISRFDAVAIEADLTTPEGIASAVEQTVADLGPIDILVLNGPGPKPGRRRHPRLRGHRRRRRPPAASPTHALVSHVLPGMRERRWGRILAVGSSGVGGTAAQPRRLQHRPGRPRRLPQDPRRRSGARRRDREHAPARPDRHGPGGRTRRGRRRRRGTTRRGHPARIPQDHPRRPLRRARRVRRRRRVPLQRPGVVHHRSRAPLRRRPDPQPLAPPLFPKDSTHDFHSHRHHQPPPPTANSSPPRTSSTANGSATPDTERMNPARPGEVVALAPSGTAADVRRRHHAPPPPPSPAGQRCPHRPAAPS